MLCSVLSRTCVSCSSLMTGLGLALRLKLVVVPLTFGLITVLGWVCVRTLPKLSSFILRVLVGIALVGVGSLLLVALPCLAFISLMAICGGTLLLKRRSAFVRVLLLRLSVGFFLVTSRASLWLVPWPVALLLLGVGCSGLRPIRTSRSLIAPFGLPSASSGAPRPRWCSCCLVMARLGSSLGVKLSALCCASCVVLGGCLLIGTGRSVLLPAFVISWRPSV